MMATNQTDARERDWITRDGTRTHERQVPDQWERYRFAGRWLMPHWRVLDIACGCGYGTHFLSASVGRRAVGLDISSEAVAWAVQNFGDGADFAAATQQFWSESRGGFDAVVSLETIEHMNEPAGLVFLQQLAEALKPGGRLVISTPLNEGPGRFSPGNPFHIREYTWQEFGNLVATRFMIERRFSQISRLGRLRELLAGSPGAAGTLTPGASLEDSSGKPKAVKSKVAGWLRSRPFWRRGNFFERPARFGGVQLIVGRRLL